MITPFSFHLSPDLSKYRDPLHVLLEYIAEVSSILLRALALFSRALRMSSGRRIVILSWFMTTTWNECWESAI